jgi:hypothetical protein
VDIRIPIGVIDEGVHHVVIVECRGADTLVRSSATRCECPNVASPVRVWSCQSAASPAGGPVLRVPSVAVPLRSCI